MAKIQDIDIPYLEFAEAAAPGTPAAAIVRTYSKSDGLMYSKDDAGLEAQMSPGAWTSYTPTMTSLTLGNGTLVGRYQQIAAKTYLWWVSLVWGSTSSFSGDLVVSLPATSRTGGSQSASGMIRDVGTTFFVLAGYIGSASAICTPFAADGAGDKKVDGSIPITWAAGDELVIGGILESA